MFIQKGVWFKKKKCRNAVLIQTLISHRETETRELEGISLEPHSKLMMELEPE